MIAEDGGDEVHELIAYALLAFVGLHILAVIAMSFLTRESLVRAMFTGNKPAERHPAARDARPPASSAYFLGALVVAGTILAIIAYDNAAFQIRPIDSVEHDDR